MWSLAFSPDGKTVAAGYSDGDAKLWDWRAGKTIAAFPHGGPPAGGAAVAFSADGTMVAVGDGNGARVWTVGGGEDAATALSPAAYSVAFSPDGKTVASGGPRTICFWDLPSAAGPDK